MLFPDLNGKRISLNEIGEYGLADLHEYSVRPELYEYLEFPVHQSLSDTKKYLDKLIARHLSPAGHYWFISHKADHKIIGTFGLLNIDRRAMSTEIGYGLSPQYWHQGLFSEALNLVLKHLFGQMNFHRIWAKTASKNVGSVKGLEVAGFKREGVLRDYYFSTAGQYFDATIYGMLRQDYFELGSAQRSETLQGTTP